MEKGIDFDTFLDPGNILFYIFLPITLPLFIIFELFGLF